MTNRIIKRMIDYFGRDVARINHALKVFGFAGCIARSETLSANEIQIIEITAILHDIGIKEAEKKYNSAIGKYQELEGPSVAREILSDEAMDSEILDRICFIIGNHHSYNKINGLDFQIIIEADFLVNIFEDKTSMSSVKVIRDNYFFTPTGISIIECMYINK